MNYVGIWIDHRKAVVASVSDGIESLNTILCDHDADGQAIDASNAPKAYTPKDFVAEDRIERKAASHLNHFYDEVINIIHNADAIHIMGPGEAKLEFKKRIDGAKLKGHLGPLETMDKMTDRQVAAHLRQIISAAVAG